ncbi:hypothetical protein [Brevibacterium antiquum]|uniref:Uncharacterized protein n=1 Tax=Brevibacterium antiquum CNRZ 918 TaxID=1255637 RepID=A0A2H1KDE3_9MICO|nr:hypothetical protein [Brevibacterium antiquum]SMX97845.1 hypothetical protein BANT918_02364 [Brevibacterium antiquum CNRZ 918]
MCDFEFVKYLLAPSLYGRNVLDPAVQADLAARRVMGIRARVKFECTGEGVHVVGGGSSRVIRWEDLDQLTIFDELEEA